jgi:hypothetical protein
MTHPEAAAPPPLKGLSVDKNSPCGLFFASRRAWRLQAPGAACKAPRWTGKAGSTGPLGLIGFMRREWRLAGVVEG